MEHRVNISVLHDVFSQVLVGLSMAPVKDITLFSGFNENGVIQVCNILIRIQP